jgi:hypothetical protein
MKKWERLTVAGCIGALAAVGIFWYANWPTLSQNVQEMFAEPRTLPETHPFGCEKSPMSHAAADCENW